MSGDVTEKCKHVRTGIRLSEETGTTGRLRLSTNFGIIETGDVHHRGVIVSYGEFASQFQSGHSPKLNVEQQAVKLWMFGIGEEGFGGGIAYWLKTCGAQQTAQGTSQTLVVIDYRDIDVCVVTHRIR